MVELKEITAENYDDCLKLEVSDSQKNFVASNMYSLAQAWVFYNTAYPFAIYAGDEMVGFIMMGYYKPKGIYNIWRFMIDKRFQNKGYGKAALLLAVKYIREKYNASELYLSFEPEKSTAGKLYNSIGFARTGEVDDGEIVMCLKM
jgi:diamine N-acetyltransferase